MNIDAGQVRLWRQSPSTSREKQIEFFKNKILNLAKTKFKQAEASKNFITANPALHFHTHRGGKFGEFIPFRNNSLVHMHHQPLAVHYFSRLFRGLFTLTKVVTIICSRSTVIRRPFLFLAVAVVRSENTKKYTHYTHYRRDRKGRMKDQRCKFHQSKFNHTLLLDTFVLTL